MGTKNIVCITGASGFLGVQLTRIFDEHGYEVRALVRRPQHIRNAFLLNLPNEIDEQAFQGNILALIHSAYETRSVNPKHAYEVNVVGTKKIIELCRKYAIPKFVFISSTAAHADAQSFYGKSKWEIEENMNLNQDLVIKPGTIIGEGGVFQRTREIIKKLPLLPLFYSHGKKMQTVLIEDLCQGILNAIEKNLVGKFVIAEKEGVSIEEFYKGIASLEHKNPTLIRFPGDLVLYLVKVLEIFGITLPITSENLLGIKCLKHFDTPDLEKIGVRVRTFQESLEYLAQHLSLKIK